MPGLTFDTGALIALERRGERMRRVWAAATHTGAEITIPSVVVAEWWRNQRGPVPVPSFFAAVTVEDVGLTIARAAGSALAVIKQRRGRPSAIDAIVMVSAASRGDVVYTSDVDDLSRLGQVFPSVRVLGVG